MFNIKGIVQGASRLAGRSGLKIQNASPELLTAAGVVGVIGTAVLAGTATLKVSDILEETRGTLSQIEEVAKTHPEKYSDMDKKKDTALVYAKTFNKLVVLYGPTIIVGGLTIASFISSNKILRARNIALAAAYKGLDEAYRRYRERVAAEVGDEVEKRIYRGTVVQEFEEKNERGETKTYEVEEIIGQSYSPYARVFDKTNPRWENIPDYNRTFLTAKQTHFNHVLRSRGHVFLNEVYDALGFPHTQSGSVVGWILDKGGDNFVDFGIFAEENLDNREFVQTINPNVVLDFNVDGVIYDKI